MSPRAAWRLEALGFTRVYDYVAGKADWGSFGLPLEGEHGSATRVSSQLCEDVPTCGLDEPLKDAQERVRLTPFDICFVVNDERVVLGMLLSLGRVSPSRTRSRACGRRTYRFCR